MKLRLIGSLAISIFGLAISAGATGQAGSGPNPYSDCGIGAAIFKNDTAAAISNVIWDLGTTAVISATASPETCEGSDAEAAAFIFETHDQLLEETAIGEGEHIESLLNIAEVSISDRQSVREELRKSVREVVSQEGYYSLSTLEKSEAYYFALKAAITEV